MSDDDEPPPTFGEHVLVALMSLPIIVINCLIVSFIEPRLRAIVEPNVEALFRWLF